ncbi:hypothetical protein [Azohydromonas australica]|uniref:hypothetical protein n=1 Tax=Azohydromonas australica TaxID=364039 RepID=UPI000412523D|nr:hypothetical protein [Azohydromonas australica]
MAELLKRDYDVVVLKVEANRAATQSPSREPQVRFTLQYHESATLVDGPVWEFSSDSIAPPVPERRMARGLAPDIVLPQAMLDHLRGWFQQHTDGTKPLWVHLVKPYGLLRLVAWERVLGHALDVPILMLPDFLFPPPREALQTLDVVLCGSAPLGHEEASVHVAMVEAARAVLGGCDGQRRVHLHVFADRDIAVQLAATWQSEGLLGHRITLYDCDDAEPYVLEDPSSRLVDQTGALRSPWLLWMRQALLGQGVDVVHFVCHGWLSRERGALLFAQSPLQRTDRYLAGPVGAVELGTFLTQVGAWSTAFTALPDNHSDAGLRWLADEIAQSRPGPLLVHTVREDPAATALAEGYAFVYALEPRPAPKSTALLLYCQPYLSSDAVKAAATDVAWAQLRALRGPFSSPRFRGMAPSASSAAAVAAQTVATRSPFASVARSPLQQTVATWPLADSPLDRYFAGGDKVSSVVASTERFVEQVHLRLQQEVRDRGSEPSAAERARMLDTAKTLAKLREAVAEIESRVLKPGESE